ncbi:class I SAM-dependent methyltransferase [Pseudomonas schmalbachii]|uniref:Class I SAM-dependent methyltransferase n=1 Tax=Pseudomonas schmalbachii TaxID=2816993 RepID=A0ABS3TRE4_9PSED|nr:class I SAM-dependent methyltransferase [Pseudomonas schmalbachii]MBO3276234.1 class I SAM-dependent methyltransferase [Pseudomonas schmalbachii]
MKEKTLLEAANFLSNQLGQDSAWLGHTPFAAWLVNRFEPSCFVELGTHWGHSYFSFCQAIKQKNLPAKCYAIDTWEGDKHAGHYSETIYNSVTSHNNTNYSSFSNLLRMTFDEALNYFSDGTIDLLHIDGLHTYEAVRHDFESWLPKLTPGAIVLLHDTNVREREFGVWKLWQELKEIYPDHLEFLHSYGLGVLQIPGATDTKRMEWLSPSHALQGDLIHYFSALGKKERERFELDLSMRTNAELNKKVALLDSQIVVLNNSLDDLNSSLASLNRSIDDRENRLTELSVGANERNNKILELERLIQEQSKRISGLSQVINQQETTLAAITSSTSWKVTKPLRWLGIQKIRLTLLAKSVRLAKRHTGSSKETLLKLIVIFRREGIRGVTSRARFLLQHNASKLNGENQPSYNKPESNIEQKNKEIPLHIDKIDIIVCVHNALDDVKRCLTSIMQNTHPPYNLIIVDDGSALETKTYLEEFVFGQPAILIRNDIAQGYTKAANIGMRASTADNLVLLNSDTIVSPKWIDRLIQCAKSSPRIGMVGPLSNTASWQSTPNLLDKDGDWSSNPLPSGYTVVDYAGEVARVSQQIHPSVGFLNGFCLLIKKNLISDIGLFDEEIFARGYGEENDYCLRAIQNGWELAVADDCFVYHAQSKSYSHETRKELAKLADNNLAKKHGTSKILHNLAATQNNLALQYVRNRCKDIENIKSIRERAQKQFEGKRILFLLPARTPGGGANIVLLEAETMRSLGADVWVANLYIHKELFEKSYPNNSVPTLYINSSSELIEIACEFDAIIATLYLTVSWLRPLLDLPTPPKLGYYVQDFEPDFFEKGTPDYKLALSSYTEVDGLTLFTKTKWTQRVLKEETSVIAAVVGPTLDTNLFHPTKTYNSNTDKITILAMVRPSTPRRAPERTMRILKRLSRHFGTNIQIMIFGCSTDEINSALIDRDFPFANLGEINSQEVSKTMATADIFIDCSDFQAMGLTAMEAMASALAVIGPQNGGLREIITDKENGLLVNTNSDDEIFEAASRLISDSKLRERIRKNALVVVQHDPIISSFNILSCFFPDDATPNSTSTTEESMSLA